MGEQLGQRGLPFSLFNSSGCAFMGQSRAAPEGSRERGRLCLTPGFLLSCGTEYLLL